MSADGSFAFSGAPSPEELAGFPLNDLGNAMRLIRLVGGMFDDEGMVNHQSAQLLYLRNRGWIAFNGRFWDLEAGEDLARRWAHKVARGLIGQTTEAIKAGNSSKAWWDFVQRSGSSGSSAAMLAQAASYLTVALDAFDQQPLTLNVANGTLKFRRDAKGQVTVKFAKAHDPADRLTRMCAAPYDAAAKAPQFDGLISFCQPREEMRAYLRGLFGYAATGSVKEQLFVILQGKGGDGKSTFVNAIRAVLGSYACSSAVETFLDTGLKKSGEASPDIARLAGDTRMVCTAEPPGGAKLASAAIKSFTGGGNVAARELRQGIFEFQPICKVVLECNRRPVINDTDDGIWRRIRIVLFEHQLAPENMDLDLPEKLRGEASGILNWIVAGVLDWMRDGLTTPALVTQAIEDYRRGANPFAEWQAERLIIDPTARTPAGELYDDYKTWCENNGHERPMTQTTFGRALGDLQILRDGKNSHGKLMRKGGRLRASGDARELAEDPFNPPPSSGGFSAPIDPDIADREHW
jgi:putative DNA primase/helicase